MSLPVLSGRAGLELDDAPLDASDWRWQVRHAITDLPALEAAIELTPDEREGTRRALDGGFPMSITPYDLGLCDPRDPTCPIRVQCVPQAAPSSTHRVSNSMCAGDSGRRDRGGGITSSVSPLRIR